MKNVVRIAVLAISSAVLWGVGPAWGAETWIRKGPGPDPLVRNVRVFPNVPSAGQSLAFVSTLGAGIVKIVDNGTTITTTPMNNGLPILRVRTVAANGTDSMNLFAGLETRGVYRSTDGGANWAASNGAGGTALGCVNVRNISVRSPTEIWAVTSCRYNSGIWRSTDTGATWSRVGTATIPDDAPVGSLTFSGSGATTVIVAATGKYGFFRSADNGATWTQINNGIPAPDGANRLSVFNASFLANANQMLGYVEGQGVFRTTDAGANWTASATGLPAGFQSLAGISRESAANHYLGLDKDAIYKTVDGGLSWAPWGNTASLPDFKFSRLVIGDSTVAGRNYVATLNGLMRTVNGLSGQFIELPEGYVGGASMAPDGRAVYLNAEVLVKVVDIYEPTLESGVLLVGEGIPGATLSGSVEVDKTNPDSIYATTNNRGLFKTTDAGANWSPVAVPGTRVGKVVYHVMDPSNTQVLFAAPGNPLETASGGGLYKSVNGGASFLDSSGGLTTPESREINSIAIHEDVPSVMFITTDDGIYKSVDSGANWTRVLRVDDALGNALPMSSVRHQSMDASIVWAAGNHTDPDGTVRASSGIWKSTDYGANWTQVLFATRTSVIRPESSGRVVAGLVRDLSQPAMLATTNGGMTWEPFDTGIDVRDSMVLARTPRELGDHVAFASMTSGLYVLDKPGVAVSVTGPGSVILSPVGTVCTTGCAQRYFHGSTVTATAFPSPGYVLAGWSGDCGGLACQLAIDGAKSITATFGLDPVADPDNDGIPNAVETAEGTNPFVMDNDVFSPGAASARLFSMQQYRDFLGREGDPAGIAGWSGLITAGTYSRLQVIDAFLNSAEFAGFVAPVVRLYFATFLRVPDYAGMSFNAGLVRAGTITVTQLADFFTVSPEFAATYGSLDNAAFVTLLYNNVLGRAPDPAGLSGWVGLLNGGMTRGQVLLGFSDSVEYQAAMANEVLVTMMYTAMLRRTPEPGGFNGWVAFLDAGTYTREQVINGFFLSTEYRGRFLP